MRLPKPGFITGQDLRTECVPFCIIDCVFRLQKRQLHRINSLSIQSVGFQ